MKAFRLKLRIIVCAAWMSLWPAAALHADTNQALLQLLDTLVKNGSLNREQAELIRAAAGDTPKPAAITNATPIASQAATGAPAPDRVYALPKEKKLTQLVVFGKIHPQWDYLSTRPSSGPMLAARNNFNMRRMQIGLNGDYGPDWSGSIEGDFARSTNTLEAGFVTYKGFSGTQIHLGHTKVPFLWEEQIADSAFKGVERSISHRAIVESSGRGFGAKNMGVHVRCELGGPFYGAASIANPGTTNSAGSAGNVTNRLAYYARLGFNGPTAGGQLEAGIDGAFLPDYLLTGSITAMAAHVLYDLPWLSLLSEAVWARYSGASRDATLTGFMIEPSIKLTEKWELVLRYAAVDSDGLGISPTTLIRSAPSTGEFDRMDSYYLGANYYFVGNAVRLTFGYEHAKATVPLTCSADENEINGLRSRFQFLF